MNIIPVSETSMRHLHHRDKIIQKKIMCLGSTKLFCLELVELEMDFRKCVPFAFFVIRNNLYMAIKRHPKITRFNCHLLYPIYIKYYNSILPSQLILHSPSNIHHEENEIITKVHPGEYFRQQFYVLDFLCFAIETHTCR